MEIVFDEKEAFYKGHFPGSPVTPGVILIDRAVAAAKESVGEDAVLEAMKKVKFSNPVLPGDKVELHLENRGGNETRYLYTKEGVRCASGILVWK